MNQPFVILCVRRTELANDMNAAEITYVAVAQMDFDRLWLGFEIEDFGNPTSGSKMNLAALCCDLIKQAK